MKKTVKMYKLKRLYNGFFDSSSSRFTLLMVNLSINIKNSFYICINILSKLYHKINMNYALYL